MQRSFQDSEPPATSPTLALGLARGGYALVAPIVFAWLAILAWVRPLSLPDEGRYAGVALEMLSSGNWLVPTLDTLPYFHKPPLFYWGTAVSMALFGTNEWAARLVSLLAATAGALALFAFLRRWTTLATARLSLLILVTTPFYYVAAQFANLDMLVSTCITITILLAADAVLSMQGNQPHRLAVFLAYCFAALGLLAKGLIGAVVPALVVLAWLVCLRRVHLLARLVSLPGLLAFCLLAGPWFAVMERRYPGFFDYFFIHHHFHRYLTEGFNNKHPFWFYGPVFAGVTLPWFALIFGSLRARGQPRETAPEIGLLMWVWLATTLIFFSIPHSKLLGYILPAVPPFAVLAALGLPGFAGTRLGRALPAKSLAICAVCLCLGVVGVLAVVDRKDVQSLAAEIRPRISPEDRIIALRHYPFSLSFYLGRSRPIQVVDNWVASEVHNKDSWRSELYDAAQFDRDAGSRLLLQQDQLSAALCSSNTWIFGDAGQAATFRVLQSLAPVAQHGQVVVWFSPAKSCE